MYAKGKQTDKTNYLKFDLELVNNQRSELQDSCLSVAKFPPILLAMKFDEDTELQLIFIHYDL